jgi:chromosomal replication initiator protein
MNEEQDYQQGFALGYKGRRFKKRSPGQLPTHYIIGVVCGFFRMEMSDLKKSVRKHRIVYPRQVCMYFLRKYSNESLLFIGHLFGGYDHGTVRASVEKIEDYLHVKQPDVADDVQALEKVFEARLSLRKAIVMGKMVSDAAVA